MGIILIATVISRKHEVFFEQSRVPIVVIGQYTDKANCVYHDDYGAAKALAEKISSSGQKEIAYIGVTGDGRVAGQAREDGFPGRVERAGDQTDEGAIPARRMFCGIRISSGKGSFGQRA